MNRSRQKERDVCKCGEHPEHGQVGASAESLTHAEIHASEQARVVAAYKTWRAGFGNPKLYIGVEWDAEVGGAILVTRAFGLTTREAL